MPRAAGDSTHYTLAVLNPDGQPTEHLYYLPSVTSILDQVLAKPALMRWYHSEAVKGVSQLLGTYGAAMPSDEKSIKQLLKDNSLNPWQKRDAAGAVGRDTHDVLELLGKGNRLTKADIDSLSPSGKAVLHWWKERKIKNVLASETVLVNFQEGYAGTLDIVFEDPVTGKIIMADLKTSSGVYYSHFLQNAAYKSAWETRNDTKIDELRVIHAPRTGASVTEYGSPDAVESLEIAWGHVLRTYHSLPGKGWSPDVLTKVVVQ